MMRIFTLVMKVGGGILKAYFSWIRRYAKHRDRYPLALRFYKVRELVRYVILKMGVTYDMPNFDDIYSDDKKKFIVCNHQSMFDCCLFLTFAKRPLTFVAKKEVLKFPFVGKILYIIEGEFFDRENLKSQVKNVLNASKLLQEQKYDVVIFPEGTRQKNLEEGLLPFHAGSFKIPQRAKSDIVVTGIFGSHRALKFFKYKKKKELYVQFKVLDELKYADYTDMNSVQLMEKSKQIIENELPIYVQKDKDYQESIS